MSIDDLLGIVREHARHLVPGEEIDPNVSLRDLGIDSLRQVGLVIKVEECFGIELPDEDLTDKTFASVGALWEVVGRNLHNSRSVTE